MKQPQHDRITLTDAIARYKNRELTTKGLMAVYFNIKLAPGWTIRKSLKDIQDELGIGRTACYTAFNQLREEGRIAADDPDKKLLSISLPIRECEQLSADADENSADADENSADADENSADADEESPKPPTNNGSGDSSSFLSSFLSSFSQDERENFLDFCEKAIARLPEKPVLKESWLSKHCEELYREFKDSDRGNYSAAPEPPKILSLEEIWERHGARNFEVIAAHNGHSPTESTFFKDQKVNESKPPESVLREIKGKLKR